jgi:adenosylcobinamide-phosphate guanylyltransferase
MYVIAVIMAGGKGSRIGYIEKPLIEFKGTKLVDIVADAVKKSKISEFFIAVSPNTWKTLKYCTAKYKILYTEGRDYHEDIQSILNKFKVYVSITVDLPFIKSEHIDEIVDYFYNENTIEKSITGVIPLKLVPKGITPQFVINDFVPVGLNIVTNSEHSEIFVFDDPKLGININTLADLDIALACE